MIPISPNAQAVVKAEPITPEEALQRQTDALKKEPKSNLYPTAAEHPNKDFHDKIVKNQEQPRGKCWVGINTFEKWGVDVDPALGMCESTSGPAPPSPISPHSLSSVWT